MSPWAAALAASLVLGACAAGAENPGGQDPASAVPLPTFAPTTSSTPTFLPIDTQPTPSETTTSVAAERQSPPTTSADSGATALGQQIASLTVAAEGGEVGFRRDLFGGRWTDADNDGCDTRCEVLEEERRTDLPGLPSGGWLSAYDGRSVIRASELDVDHLVPLAEAWRSGASSWPPERRLAYANDLDRPSTLIAVTATSNRAKADGDPAEWQPPRIESWCDYASDWVTTKLAWGLSADPAEIRALTDMATSANC